MGRGGLGTVVRRLVPSQRSRTVGAFTALTVALATLAFLHDGTEVADVELHDGGVWVTNRNLNGIQVAAHLNYPSRQLDANTPSIPGTFLDLSQEANAVVVTGDGQSLGSVDTMTWLPDSTPAQLPDSAHFSQGTDVVAVADPNQGKVWAIPATEVASFSPDTTEPVLTGAIGVRVAIGKDDVVHAVLPDGTLRDVRRTGGGWQVADAGSVPALTDAELQQVQVSAVGRRGVVLNPTAGWIAWDGNRVDLPQARDLVLQESGDDMGSIALAGPSGFVQVPMDGGDPVTIAAPPGGTPVAPVTVGSCAYGAWVGTGAYLRECRGSADDVAMDTYPQMQANTELVFRTNRDVVVLNDPSNGDIFLVNEEMEKIADWTAVMANLNQEQEDQTDTTIAISERSEENTPPEPRDDEFGVRPGATVTLPVLGNDRDADGDVLVARLADSQLARVGTLEPVRDGRAVRLSVDGEATPGRSATFTYTADDGRPQGTADAQVSITVRRDSENSPPRLLAPERESALTIQARGSGEHHILQEWVDPDGDPFWVSGVDFGEGLSGTYRPDGLIQVTDSGRSDLPSERIVKVTLTDGRVNGSRTVDFPVTVLPVESQAKPVANADFVTTLAATGTEAHSVLVRPLANDHDPNGDQLFFSLVGQVPEGLQVTTNPDDSLTIVGTRPGSTDYVEYSITDGSSTVTSVIRVDTLAPAQARPIPDGDLAVLPPNGEVLVDVLANDTDPLGGVLVVESVNVGSVHEVRAEVVDHAALRITDVNLPEGRPVTISYQVGNGAQSGTGTVTVVLDPSRTPGAPVAGDDAGQVREGDVVTVDVLRNDVSPTDLALEVLPLPDDAISMGEELGIAWVSENKVRFMATGGEGQVRINYTVRDTELRTHSASVRLTVNPLQGANRAPSPQVLTGRLVQGGEVVIPIPVAGIDPDGDSVSIVGLDVDRLPTKGTVSFDGNNIVYRAANGEANRGTDRFRYVVEDRFNRQGFGEVEVGIAAPPTSNLPPIAVLDERRVRPDRLVAVPVAANDIDPEGGALTLLDDVEQVGGPSVHAEVVDGRVQVRTPAEAGTVSLRYRIRDDLGEEASGDLVIDVDPDAPLLPPIARDDVLSVPEIIGRDEVTVDVLRNDEDPDGAVSELTPEVSVPGVRVTDHGELVIPVRAERQVVLYALTDPDGQTGRAVVVVPGDETLAAQRPAIRPDAPLPIEVDAGGSVQIDLADYVVVRDGRTPTLPFSEGVHAGPGHDGSQLKTGDSQITFGAVDTFHGPSSVTAIVSDASGSDDAAALTNTISLPVFVNASGNTQPDVRVPSITVAPQEAWVGDLDLIATDPDPGDQARLTFAAEEVEAGLDVRIDAGARTISVEPASGAEPGPYTFDLVVSDGSTAPVRRTAEVSVVASTRELLTVRDVDLTVDAAAEQVIDLADYVTFNPFEAEGEPVRMVEPPQVVTGTADSVTVDDLVVTVVPGADFHGTLRLTYLLADASGLPDRRVQGQVNLNVRGFPDAPTTVTTEAGNQQVQVDWAGAEPNGAPITGYRVAWTSTGGDSGEATTSGPQTTHTARGLRNGDTYRFQVFAINEVGESHAASPWSPETVPDYVPAAPAGVAVSFDDGRLHVTWTQPDYEGTPVERYEVFVNGSIIDAGADLSQVLPDLANGTQYEVKVRALNQAEAAPFGTPGASAWSASVIEHPNAEPRVTGISIVADAPDADPSAQITWTVDDGGHQVADFEVRRVGGQVVSCVGPATGSTCRVSLAGAGRDQQFQVRVFNRANADPARGIDGWGEWSAPTAQVTGALTPKAVKNLKASPTGGSGTATVSFDFTAAELQGADRVEFYSNRTGATVVGTGTGHHTFTVTGLTNGTDSTVEVWAKTYANTSVGGGSADSARASTSVNTFAPCTVSVGSPSSGTLSVTFNWRVVSHGRQCKRSGNHSFPTATSGSANGTYKVATSREDQAVTLTLTVATVTVAGDPAVASNSASASGRSAKPTFAHYNAGAAPYGTGNCNAECYWVGVEAWNVEPGRYVECPVVYSGEHYDGQTFWHPSQDPADANGHLKGRLASIWGGEGVPASVTGAPPGDASGCRVKR
ncbi:Ig-like domain-containing protein [Nocardioides sp. AE5]|uniref:Ig-like domain-containing protein n=1 Tax=Nocardioides sp. AE5 TaxID=2962573 RepID=UPI002881ABE2|nr:Ig-like domain-containing protein [Nocardioides sp. AE5]MDT0200340.1 Ig-like domain-containing protein [Nocardioides sp. AE5]